MNPCLACIGALLAAALGSPHAAELPAAVVWTAASGGQAPAQAIEAGRARDGQPQFACRAAWAGGVHTGQVLAGAGCAIAVGPRAVTVAAYEVLALKPPLHLAQGLKTAVVPGVKVQGVLKPPVGTVPPISGGDGLRRGFDDNGVPFVEQTRPDGSVVRVLPNGSRITYPDGREVWQPLQYAMSNAQAATPPELPTDPQRGRLWLERHNQALLGVVRVLVGGEDAEMQRFASREQTVAQDDLFKQIAYRTEIANFLAKAR